MSEREPATDEVTAENGPSTDNAEAEEEQRWWESEDLFEGWATVLIALAAILTAWAGFESAKWGGVQATNFSQAGAARTESVRFSTLAGQQATIDVTTWINWLNNAVRDIDSGEIEDPTVGERYEPTPGTPSGFFFERFRPEFEIAVNAWLDTSPFGENADAPATPFEMEEYQLEAETQSVALQDEADQKASDAGTANQNSDNYVITAVLFASSLFFAALASRLGSARYRYAALIIASLLFLGTFIYVLSLPIEI